MIEGVIFLFIKFLRELCGLCEEFLSGDHHIIEAIEFFAMQKTRYATYGGLS